MFLFAFKKGLGLLCKQDCDLTLKSFQLEQNLRPLFRPALCRWWQQVAAGAILKDLNSAYYSTIKYVTAQLKYTNHSMCPCCELLVRARQVTCGVLGVWEFENLMPIVWFWWTDGGTKNPPCNSQGKTIHNRVYLFARATLHLISTQLSDPSKSTNKRFNFERTAWRFVNVKKVHKNTIVNCSFFTPASSPIPPGERSVFSEWLDPEGTQYKTTFATKVWDNLTLQHCILESTSLF